MGGAEMARGWKREEQKSCRLAGSGVAVCLPGEMTVDLSCRRKRPDRKLRERASLGPRHLLGCRSASWGCHLVPFVLLPSPIQCSSDVL